MMPPRSSACAGMPSATAGGSAPAPIAGKGNGKGNQATLFPPVLKAELPSDVILRYIDGITKKSGKMQDCCITHLLTYLHSISPANQWWLKHISVPAGNQAKVRGYSDEWPHSGTHWVSQPYSVLIDSANLSLLGNEACWMVTQTNGNIIYGIFLLKANNWLPTLGHPGSCPTLGLSERLSWRSRNLIHCWTSSLRSIQVVQWRATLKRPSSFFIVQIISCGQMAR